MRCGQSKIFGGQRRVSRGGFMCLGALREIVVISLAATFVLVSLTQASTVFSLPSLSDDPHALNRAADPILSLGFDEDQRVLIAHTWREELNEIKLDTGIISKRRTPQNLISIASSLTSSTSIMLSEWTDNNQNQLQVYITRERELLLSEKFSFPNTFASDVRISADGSVAMIVFHDGFVVAWDLTSPETVRWEFELGGKATTSSLSPDGRSLLIVPDNKCASIHDTRTGEKLVSLPSFVTCNRAIGWSGDSQRLAIGDQDGGLHIFDAASGKTIWQHKLEFLFARSIALSSQGNLLAAGGFDKKIRVWDVSTPASPPVVLTGEPDVIHNFVFTNSDSRLISGSAHGTICEWSLASCRMVRKLR